jgi:FtsP/CotA-like multicopper oxidase with cupredoxin domain
MAFFSRRELLGAGGATALGVGVLGARAATAATHDHHAAAASATSHSGLAHGGGAAGPTFADGAGVDAAANGFDPTEILRDFDWGTTSRAADGTVVREWELFASDHEVEVAPGVRFPAWTFNGRIPGPTLRCREGERLRIHFRNGSHHPHTMHFHGIHPSDMDGVAGQGAGLVAPGDHTVYEFEAEPFGLHLFHCHAGPLAEHIARGMYGTFIVDPPEARAEADELVMVQHGYNTTFDGEGNQLYAVNGIPFHYMREPVRVRRGELVRIYLSNVLEYDPINSFHLHGNFFHYFPTGTSLTAAEYTDTISQVQGQRGILELRFPHLGPFMFHAHKTEFAELGWMGMFEVVE